MPRWAKTTTPLRVRFGDDSATAGKEAALCRGYPMRILLLGAPVIRNPHSKLLP
jgi:hypothetical protein